MYFQGLQSQERNLFLFNDLLLIAKERSTAHYKLKDQVRQEGRPRRRNLVCGENDYFQSGNMTLFVLTFHFIFHFLVLLRLGDLGLIWNCPCHCSLVSFFVKYDFIIQGRVPLVITPGLSDKMRIKSNLQTGIIPLFLPKLCMYRVIWVGRVCI